MPGPEDYRCCVDGCNTTNAAWGFHGRFYCDAHRTQGENLMVATSDGVSTPAALPEHEPPPGAPTQGRLL